MRLASFVAAVLALCAGPLACASSTANGGLSDAGATTGDAAFGCNGRGQTYAANLEQTGSGGSFTFVLVSSTPAPPAIYNNSWTLKLLDKSGNMVKDATFPPLSEWQGWPIGIRPYMPDHGHASSAWPSVTPNTDGTYTIEPVYLMMAGLWQITINAQSGSTTDSAVFSFCVEG